MTLPATVAVGDPITAATTDQLIAAVAVTASGTIPVPIATANVVAATAVTFPVGRFSSPPAVFCTALTGPPNGGSVFAWPSGITTSGFTMNAMRSNTTTTTCGWLAIVTP